MKLLSGSKSGSVDLPPEIWKKILEYGSYRNRQTLRVLSKDMYSTLSPKVGDIYHGHYVTGDHRYYRIVKVTPKKFRVVRLPDIRRDGTQGISFKVPKNPQYSYVQWKDGKLWASGLGYLVPWSSET